tara:strand:+ start:4894 stop:5484 length:591 start_codon:yes stop_codon:yes gene_type:complete
MALRGRYVTLIEEVAKRKPKTILEIGTHCGNSAIHMVNEAKKHVGRNDDVFYYGFDIFDWGDKEFMESEFNGKRSAKLGKTKLRLDKAGINNKLHVGNTKNTLKKFSPDRFIDFVFIDGGHSVETIASDWGYVKHLMDRETVVIFDDYYENRDDFGCKNLIDSLEKDDGYNVERLDPLEIVEKNDIHLRLAKVTRR